MTCEECRERLQEMVDDELAARERKAVETHLSTCARCTQEYKEVAHFTTSVAKAVRPLGPSAELSSKVLTVYHESREQLKAAPAPAPQTARTALPSWAWRVAVGVLIVAGFAVLVWPSGVRDLGVVTSKAKGVRVLRYSASGWQSADRIRLCVGDRVESTETEAEVPLDFGAWGEAILKGRCAVQIDMVGETLTLQLLQQSPGTIVLRSRAASSVGARRLHVTWGSAWVEVNAGERNEATVVPLNGQGGGWTGQLKVSVEVGVARLGNTGGVQTVAEGFSRIVPQSGDCEAAVKVDLK